MNRVLSSGCAAILLVLGTASDAGAYCRDYWTVEYKRMMGCLPPVGGGGPVQTGPTQEELRQQREAKDATEAAQDAEDKGDDSYQKGDYSSAVNFYKESLDYSDDDAIRRKLDLAQQRVRQTEAARQAASVQKHSADAAAGGSLEQISDKAGRGFDTAGAPAGPLTGPAVAAPTFGADPVVPDAKRTPQITALEKQRDQAKKTFAALETQKKALDPKTDAVKISAIKEKESKAESTVKYLNFSINAALDGPSPTSAKSPAQ